MYMHYIIFTFSLLIIYNININKINNFIVEKREKIKKRERKRM